ncbi:MAG TPA: hypothetical protein VIL32_14340 [Steroidobacteraceae bacterium]
MKIMTTSLMAAMIAVSLMGTTASAQSLPESLRACAMKSDDEERLRCYDEQMAALGVRAESYAAPRSAESAELAIDRSSVKAPAAPATSKTAGSAAQPVKATANADTLSAARTDDDFGLPPESSRKQESRVMTSRVRSVVVRPTGLSIELENGQVWVEQERRSTFRVSPGETVTIRSGVLGSYFLSTESKATARVVRVR